MRCTCLFGLISNFCFSCVKNVSSAEALAYCIRSWNWNRFPKDLREIEWSVPWYIESEGRWLWLSLSMQRDAYDYLQIELDDPACVARMHSIILIWNLNCARGLIARTNANTSSLAANTTIATRRSDDRSSQQFSREESANVCSLTFHMVWLADW